MLPSTLIAINCSASNNTWLHSSTSNLLYYLGFNQVFLLSALNRSANSLQCCCCGCCNGSRKG